MRKEKLRKFEFVAIGLVVSMMLICVFSARAFASFAGDIYIRAEGSIDPSNAPIATSDNVTYTLTADVSGTLTIERDNIIFDGAGHAFTGSGAGPGITLSGRTNVTVKDTTIQNFYGNGIYLGYSSRNTVSGNNFANNVYGIVVYSSSDNNTLSGNTVTANYNGGIIIGISSNNNVVSGNNVASSIYAITIHSSSRGNIVSGNNATNSVAGIVLLYSANNNVLSDNNVTNNQQGVLLTGSSGNVFFHNRLVNNGQQVSSDGSPNTWDNGYPSGGNYWSNYAGTDVYSGPGQNVSGSDGIGDAPYVVDSNNVDHYPLYASTFTPHQLIITVLPSNGGTTDPLAGDYSAYASSVIVSATPNAGYQLSHWMLDGSGVGAANPITVTMDTNHTLQAVFNYTGDIYIRADGSVDPWNAPIATSDNVTYTLTANVLGTVTIERDNIVFDGAGYTFTGSGAGYGITLSGRTNVTVKDTTVESFYGNGNGIGIYLYSSSNNTLSGNNLANNWCGIGFYYSCLGNTVSGNNVANNVYGLDWCGIQFYYSCLGNTVSGNNVANNVYGIVVYSSSDNNTLSGNTVTANYNGIYVLDSKNNTLSGNNVTANSVAGIVLDNSCGNNTLSGNDVTNNYYGIMLASSYGTPSSGNTFFHNRFVNNVQQVSSDGSTNTWDNGYPSGGNYWSDYARTDLYDGPLQNLPGSDGIGDTPYTIDGNNLDNYPWMAANYTVPYQITFNQTGIGDDFGGPVITVDGADYDRSGVSFWWKADSEHTFSYHSPLVASEDAKRYAWMSVSGLSNGQSDNLTVTGSGSVTGNYLAQYYLTVVSTYDTPLGEGWYDSGVLANFSVSSPAAGDTGVQYVCMGFTGDASGAGTSGSIIMSDPKSITFSWKTQYQVSFAQTGSAVAPNVSYSIDGGSVVVDTAPFDVWVDSGSSIAYTYTVTVPGGTGIQYVFTGVTPTSPQTVTGTLAVTGFYKTQYYLTVTSPYDSPTPLSGWFDSGSNITASVTSPVSGGSGIRYGCTGWSGIGSVPSSGSATSVTLTIGAPSTIAWNWQTQYYLTVNSAHDTPSGAGWYDADSTAYFNVSTPVSGGAGIQYVCTGFTGNASGLGTSGSITMSAPAAVTFTWKTQYYLIVISTQDSPAPPSGWFDRGTRITENVTSPVSGPSGTRYVCTGWIGTGNVPSSGSRARVTFSIVQPSSIIWTWKTQYTLTMAKNFGTISPSVGTHWYEAGSTVNVSATAPSVQNGEQFVWNGWIGSGSGSYTGQDNPAVNEVTMNGPVDETASWTHQYLLIINSNGVPSPYSTSIIMNGITVGKASDGSPFTLWIIAGTSTGTIGVDTQVSVNSDTRYVFTSWSGGSKANPRSPILMNAPKTVTANYTTQYRVTFSQAGIANDFTGTVVKIDGVSYTQTGLPTSLWWNNGSSHTFQFMSPLKTSSGQYVWASTTGLSTAQSGRITVSSSGNVTANYTKK